MSIPSKQIGWSQESNLLYEILRQFNKLSCSLCSINENALSNPCYVEILLNQEADLQSLTTINSFFEIRDVSSQLFTGIVPIVLGSSKVSGYRLYGGKNLIFQSLGNSSNLGRISSVNDPCGIITKLNEGLFENTFLTYANLPGVIEINSSYIFKGVINSSNSLYVNMPNLEYINGLETFVNSVLTEFRAPKLKSIIGDKNFENCDYLKIIYTPMLYEIGSADCTINENNFSSINGITLTVTLKASLTTCNAGAPEADLAELISNNTVTLITT